ncbi:MAG: hypothetical protein Q4C42_10515 [Clostridia bacterium]|nr:hypothetical protein [Clostridia bacterium]
MKEKFLNMMGLCRRAGKLVWGYDSCVTAVKDGTAKGLIAASDISPKTLKNLKFEGDRAKLETVTVSVETIELSYAVGKRAGVYAVLDEGFFKKLKELAEHQGKDAE